jgi:glutathione S-transferase
MAFNKPVCYTFRRCPYAIRARMAIDYSKIDLEFREIIFKNKPTTMLAASPKGTVPVLVQADGSVLDESRDILWWCVEQNDPENWASDSSEFRDSFDALVDENDGSFKNNLDKYKYSDRFPEFPAEHYRSQGEMFLQKLESLLEKNHWLLSGSFTLADDAIFPFIRQFSMVDIKWFNHVPYPKLRSWLTRILESERFQRVMVKRPLWAF